MKHIITSLIIGISLLLATDLIIHKTDGTTVSIPIGNIESITFGIDNVSCGTVTDIDGNIYQTVQIGDQCWMDENLKVAHYNDGTEIPTGYSNGDWINLYTGAYAVYVDNPVNADVYGYFYNWYAVETGSLAPEGWHVPTDDEIKELEMYLGMSQGEADDTDWRGTNEGSKLAGRADLWYNGNLENNPEFGTSGFDFLPGGYRSNINGNYYNMGLGGYFWSSTEFSSGNAWYRALGYNLSEVYRYDYHKEGGFSVRCVRD